MSEGEETTTMREIMVALGCGDPLRVYWAMPSSITSLEMNDVKTGNQLIDGAYPRRLVDEYLAELCARLLASPPRAPFYDGGDPYD